MEHKVSHQRRRRAPILASLPPSPKQVHQSIMKSTLGRAISLRKLDTYMPEASTPLASGMLSKGNPHMASSKTHKTLKTPMGPPPSHTLFKSH